MFALKFQAGEISLYPLARVAAEEFGAALGWRRRWWGDGAMAAPALSCWVGRERELDRSAQEGYPACVRSQISAGEISLYPLARVAAEKSGAALGWRRRWWGDGAMAAPALSCWVGRERELDRSAQEGYPACVALKFPAGAVVLFIHWRWQPTGAGDLFFMDRRWPSAAEAAAGRPRPRATTLGHAAVRAQELLRVNHFRQPHARARGANSRSRFHFLVSAAPTASAMPRLAALPPMVPAAELSRRPSYAVAAAGRPRPRATVGGLRRVLALDFQVGFPAGAVVLFIHWRWQPTGAGDLFFMDRRWPSAAEAAAGRPRPRATTLGHAAVRAQELLRVNHFRQPHARARGADSRSRFHFLVSAAPTASAMPRLAALAADGAGGGAQSRPSYAVAAAGRPRPRATVRGAPAVFLLSIGHPYAARRAAYRPDGSLLMIGEFIAHDLKFQVWEIELGPSG